MPQPEARGRERGVRAGSAAPWGPGVRLSGTGSREGASGRGLTWSLRRNAYNSRRAHRVPPPAPPRGTFAARGQGAGCGRAVCGPHTVEPPVAAARQPARQGPAARALRERSPGLRPALPRRVGQEGGSPGRQSSSSRTVKCSQI